MELERSLRYAVLALQAGYIDAAKFADVCTRWSQSPEQALNEILIVHAGLNAEQQEFLAHLLPGEGHHSSDAPTRVAADPSKVFAPVLLQSRPGTGTAVERYTRRQLHATGGMGQVWLAHDANLNRDVALKELNNEVRGDGSITSRFVLEAQVTGQLEHPGIVPVYDFAWATGTGEPFYTMRFVRGRTMVDASLDFHEKREKNQADPLELVSLLSAFVAVCNTIAYAHSRRILHRDLKGENILLGDFGEVVVLDWGLAKSLDTAEERSPAAQTIHYEWLSGNDKTIQGSIIGTPGYMAPEQADGRLDEITERTDIYGLGAILYEILTGQPPSSGDTALEAIAQAQRGELTVPHEVWEEVPPALEAACLRALAKDPAHRFASAIELGQEVQRWQDVQRRRAEAALERQSEILQSILNSMGEGVIVIDPDENVLQINPAAERILGSYPVGTKLVLRPGYEILLPDRVTPCPREQLPVVRALAGEELDDMEFFVRTPSRPEGHWVSANGRPLVDHDGHVRGGLVVVRDISERKRAEEELRRSRERFDLAVQGSQDGLWDWDLENNIIYYSPRWKSIIGYEDHEIGSTIEDWETRLHPDERERVLAANYAHIDGSTPHYEYEYRLRHKDGSYRWILARGVALRHANGKAYRMAGSHVDVTSRREAEQALKESENRYNAVIASLPVGITVVDREARIIATNPTAEEILGLTGAQMQGLSLLTFQWRAIHEDGAPFPTEDFPALVTLRGGGAQKHVVMGLAQATGTLRWLSVNSEPLFHPSEPTPYAVVASFADITEFKALEKELKSLRASAGTAQ